MEISDVLTTVQGKALTVHDVLEHLKAHGVFRNAIYELIELEVVRLEAEARDISVVAEELNEYLDYRRELLGIGDAVAMNEYCTWLGITYASWSENMRDELLRFKLRDALITDEMVYEYFREHGAELKNVSISRIVCNSRAEIDAVMLRLCDGNADFGALARKHSVESATHSAGGYVGTLPPGMLPAEIEQAVFAAKENDILGPFETEGRWSVYKVINVENADLSEGLRDQIAGSLFEQWLNESTQRARA